LWDCLSPPLEDEEEEDPLCGLEVWTPFALVLALFAKLVELLRALPRREAELLVVKNNNNQMREIVILFKTLELKNKHNNNETSHLQPCVQITTFNIHIKIATTITYLYSRSPIWKTHKWTVRVGESHHRFHFHCYCLCYYYCY
jgi:hypothetical protein